MTKKELYDKVVELLQNMNIDEQFEVFCEYCISCNLCDDMPNIVNEYDFNVMCRGMKATEILSIYRDLDFSWDYYYFSIYGVEKWEGIETTSTYDEVGVYIVENLDSCYNKEIEELLWEYEENEE